MTSVVSLGLLAGNSWSADSQTPLYGRVSAVAGTVQYHSTAGEWAPALANEPVAEGTALRTAETSEAELRSHGALVALAPASELRFVRFDGDAMQIVLASGRLGLHLDLANPTKSVEIDLPHGGVRLSAPGDYDIAAGDAHTPAAVQVFAGAAQPGGGLAASQVAEGRRDWFSDWWRSQNDNADATVPASPALPGAAALAEAGRWELDDRLGNVWFPSDLSADWVPYRDGVWRFLAPWGWTWVDNTAWGFATSHYGRWARIDGKWGWVPGSPIADAAFSPAEVAFLGTAGIGLSRPGDAGPAIAWFPLAPGETAGAGADADGAYANRAFATAVPRPAFAAGLPVAVSAIDDVPPRRFADAPVILQALGIPPIGAPVVAAAPRRPEPVAAAAATPEAPQAAPSSARQPFVVVLRDEPAREPRRRMRLAEAIVVRPHLLASPLHSPHNRRHLAAARGGA